MTTRLTTARFLVWATLGVVPWGVTAAAEEGVVFRVENEVFVNDDETPVSKSLTLFANGVTWDFLDPRPKPCVAGGSDVAEVILHDAARERVVMLDATRSIKTEIKTIQLERLNVSLAKWARKAGDPLIRWAGGPDFGEAFAEETKSHLELAGPRVRYLVDFSTEVPADAAAAYRRFADTAILLKALMQPGGIPPFPRLAVNRRVEAAGGVPTSVTLELAPRLAVLPGQWETYRSVHKLHPQLIDGDRSRIDAAAARMGVAEAVDLDEFVRRRQVDPTQHPDS